MEQHLEYVHSLASLMIHSGSSLVITKIEFANKLWSEEEELEYIDISIDTIDETGSPGVCYYSGKIYPSGRTSNRYSRLPNAKDLFDKLVKRKKTLEDMAFSRKNPHLIIRLG